LIALDHQHGSSFHLNPNDVCDCGSRKVFTDIEEQLNRVIDAGNLEKGVSCCALKATKLHGLK
jgi:hypothetical protein